MPWLTAGCVLLLFGQILPVKQEELLRPPCAAAVATLRQTIDIQRAHWPCLQRLSHTVTFSYAESQRVSGGAGGGGGCRGLLPLSKLTSLELVPQLCELLPPDPGRLSRDS